MRKIIAVAGREYRAMVGTKAFLISITMMPLLMFGSILATQFLKNSGGVETRRIVVIDHSGKLFDALDLAAKAINAHVDAQESGEAATENAAQGERDDDFGEGESRKKYALERWERDTISDEERLELSGRIRNRELYAFLEIPADVLEVRASQVVADPSSLPAVTFYSEDSSFSDARQWLGAAINEFARTERLKEKGIDPKVVTEMSVAVPIRGLSPLSRTASGEISRGEERDALKAIFVPLGIMMLMFMVVFMSAQPMLETVLEEKSARIAEVLLGSVNSWQLMTGKLIGTVGGSLTILAVYVIGVMVLAINRGWTDQIPFGLIPWFLMYQILGVLFFASIFMAVGASVTQLKEAQTLLLPVWMLMMSPMFVWLLIVREPNSTMSTMFSFFPPATPTVMALRMSTDATIPWWQPPATVALLIISTMLCVFVASRIFRVGLLWQGKTPRFQELLRWAISG